MLAACDGEAARRSSGIISMPTPDEWIDVRAIEANGAATVWSKRYRRTSKGEGKSSSCKGSAGRKAVRRGGR